MDSISSFTEDWGLPVYLTNPDGIRVANFLIGYRAYSDFWGLERLLFNDVIKILRCKAFIFDQNGITGPVALRKWET